MPSKAIETWNERFAREGYVFGTSPNEFLKRETHRLAPGQSVLAVADGEGRNSVWLAKNGLRVDAVDGSSVAIEKARRLAGMEGVSIAFEEADLETWTWPRSTYDAVIAIFIQFAGPALRAHIFEGMKKALKPDGLLLMEGYRPEQIAYGTGGPRIAENLYDEPMLQRAFAEMEILHLLSYDAEIHEGEGHSGRSALIDLVARKSG
jgi:2-polyprenyl-3-methyl-5-hydroxy-6-metoxy-1,4-benzoquinol methylase